MCPTDTQTRLTSDLTQFIVQWLPVLCTPEERRKMVRIACVHAAFERFLHEQRSRTNDTW